MRYYKYLSVYDSVISGTIDSAAKAGAIDGQQGNVKSVLALTPEESASWEALKTTRCKLMKILTASSTE